MADPTLPTPEKRWWAPFLSKFAETGIVALSCRYAKVHKDTVYTYRRDCPEFAARYADAEKQAVVVLEDVATKRAIEKSDTMLIFLLKCRDREKYGDVIRQENTGPDGGPQVIKVDFGDATLDQLRALAWPEGGGAEATGEESPA